MTRRSEMSDPEAIATAAAELYARHGTVVPIDQFTITQARAILAEMDSDDAAYKAHMDALDNKSSAADR